MIVARSFSPPPSSFLSEKDDLTSSRTRSRLRQQSRSPQRSAPSPTRVPTTSSAQRSDPVKIPTRNNKSAPSQTRTRSAPIVIKPKNPALHSTPVPKPRKQSAQEILSATAIPRRKRISGRPAQRLPQGDHVADFSKLLFGDLQMNKEHNLSRSQGSPNLDALFGNIDELLEDQIIVGSEPLDAGSLSVRSASSDSLASLDSPEDDCSAAAEHRSCAGRSPQIRATPRMSLAEDCSLDHPLVGLDKIDSLSLNSTESTPSSTNSTSPRNTSPPPQTLKKEQLRSTFKSTLTSSLKALKSAARTTLLSSSGFGPYNGTSSQGLYTNESILAHNFFDIQPSLTDDRRPPPTVTRPSPELRRYLNPQMASAPADSPVQLHFWQDERYPYDVKRENQVLKDKIKYKNRRKRSPGPKSKVDSLPRVVPLSTCLPPTVRTTNASSPPIWLNSDGEPINKTSSGSHFDAEIVAPVGNGMSKHREPRENRDFLRMYVCEAAMRRSGKLSDDLASGRARLWLPPLAGSQNQQTDLHSPRKTGSERWRSWTAEDLQG